MDTGVTQAMIDGEEPLTPRHIYSCVPLCLLRLHLLCKLRVGGVVCSAMRVQKMIVEKRRNAKFAALKDLAVRHESSCPPFQVPVVRFLA